MGRQALKIPGWMLHEHGLKFRTWVGSTLSCLSSGARTWLAITANGYRLLQRRLVWLSFPLWHWELVQTLEKHQKISGLAWCYAHRGSSNSYNCEPQLNSHLSRALVFTDGAPETVSKLPLSQVMCHYRRSASKGVLELTSSPGGESLDMTLRRGNAEEKQFWRVSFLHNSGKGVAKVVFGQRFRWLEHVWWWRRCWEFTVAEGQISFSPTWS